MNRRRFVADAAAFLALAGLPGRVDARERSASPAPESSSSPNQLVHGIDSRLTLTVNRPVDLKLQALDAPDFHLTACRGLIVFLNIFATWCGPCQDEQPAFIGFAAAHADDTVVVGVNYGEADDLVRRYRKRYGIPYLIAMDRKETLVPVLFRQSIHLPTTIVVGPDGIVSSAWIGDCDRAWLESERLAAFRTA